MKAFLCNDDDGGRRTIVISENIKTAIQLFEMMNNCIPPERVYDLTTDGEMIIIEGVTAPYDKEDEQ
jgi:hypothetical protein